MIRPLFALWLLLFPVLVAPFLPAQGGRECYCDPCRCKDCQCILYAAKVGGRSEGKTEIQIDFPGTLHRKNTASHGLGLCVFTSLHHAALWQDVPQFQEFPKWMIDKSIPGGGYPAKVADLSKKISADRKLPEPEFLQVEGADLEILKLACATGRMPAVTYSRSPTGRYGGGRIAHMVNLVHADDEHFVVLDNNYVGESNYEWMTPQEFKSTYAGTGGGWSVILLACGPPPVPRN